MHKDTVLFATGADNVAELRNDVNANLIEFKVPWHAVTLRLAIGAGQLDIFA